MLRTMQYRELYRRLSNPRYCFDIAMSKVWIFLGPDFSQPDRQPNLVDTLGLHNMVIEWPRHYGWPMGNSWVDSIRSGLSRYVAVREVDFNQIPNVTAVQIKLFHKGVGHKIVIDYCDEADIIFDDYLADCLLYFKMQFRNGGYKDYRIMPGQYVPSSGLNLYRYLTRLRRIRDDTTQLKFDVYGRFGLYPGSDIRSDALSILNAQNRFRYEGGSTLLALTRSLSEAAMSKVCIDLPGRGPLCKRLVDYLSIGSCIVAYPHQAALYPPLVPGRHIAYCRPDFSDLVEICNYYLTHEQERQAMIQASREYFDTFLNKDCIASYYLECIATQLGLPLKEPEV
jgi:hypothetical protein